MILSPFGNTPIAVGSSRLALCKWWPVNPALKSLLFAVVNLDSSNPITIELATCEDCVAEIEDQEAAQKVCQPGKQVSFATDNIRGYYRLYAWTTGPTVAIKFEISAR